jgi:hypothetical protein
MVDEILHRLSCGESMRHICADSHLPDRSTAIRWLTKDDEFAAKYARAREIQAHVWVDEMFDLAQTQPEINPQSGAIDSASVSHIRNQVATMQWLAAKLNPKRYGDKVGLDHSGTISLVVSTGVPDDD